MKYVETDFNGRKYVTHYCERCGKRTEGIHTCSPNPVIEKLQAENVHLHTEIIALTHDRDGHAAVRQSSHIGLLA